VANTLNLLRPCFFQLELQAFGKFVNSIHDALFVFSVPIFHQNATVWQVALLRRGRFDSAIECNFGGKCGLTRSLVRVVSLFSNVIGKSL